jgi:hypothetical protein
VRVWVPDEVIRSVIPLTFDRLPRVKEPGWVQVFRCSYCEPSYPKRNLSQMDLRCDGASFA